MASTILADNGASSGSAGIKTTADSTGALALQTSTTGGTATTAVTIDTSQNVGLGVAPSAWGVGVALDMKASGSAAYLSSNAGLIIGANFYNNGVNNVYKTSAYSGRYYINSTNGSHAWYTAPSWNGTGSDTITFTQAMTLDASGNLGIGTSSPGAKLDVNSGTNSEMRVTTSGSGYLQVGQFTNGAFIGTSSTDATAGLLRFGTGGSVRATIDGSGNLGLGVTPSAWASGSKAIEVGSWGAISSNSTSGNLELTENAIQSSNAGAFVYKNNGPAARYAQALGNHQWQYAASGTAGNAISFTQAMTLDASGNLAIGVTSAATNVQIAGSSGITLGAVAGNTWRTAAIAPIDELGSYKGALAFYTHPSAGSAGAPTERARIDSSGNLLVGTTSGITNGGILATPASGESYLAIGHKSGSASGNYYLAAYYNGSLVGGLTQSGTTGIVLTNLSDYRLKENVLPMQDSLAKVLTLNPVSYKWKSDGSDGEGFIAHELQAVIPTAATGAQDEVDEEGNAKYQGINLSALVPHLVKAIQEQQALITTLTERITALENK